MPLSNEERRKIYEEEGVRLEARQKLEREKSHGCFFAVALIVLVLLAIIVIVPYQRGKNEKEARLAQTNSTVLQSEDLEIFKKVDKGQSSLWMELIIKSPTKEKIEQNINSLIKARFRRDRLQIDIFDDLEALQRRGDQGYPASLFNKHWLVSITKDEIYRFYLKERPDIE